MKIPGLPRGISKSWLALVIAPSTALAAQGAMYALVTPSCSQQAELRIHAIAAVALTVALVLAVLAYGESSLHRGEAGSHDSDEAHGGAPSRFLATVASAVAAISALVILAMWLGVWVFSPCGFF